VKESNGSKLARRAWNRPPLPRSPTGFLTRIAVSLVMASFGGMAAATHAWALDQGDDVSRVFSFGGMCVSCELSGRKLPDARFMGANFSSASMVGSDLRGAWFFGTNFSKADLSRANLSGASLFGSDFVEVNFTDANLSGVKGHGANFTGANLTRTRFEAANLLGADLMRVNAHDSNFTGASLLGANLDEGHFDRALFRNANFFGASLASAAFPGADFTGAVLNHANLAGADLSSAKGLSQTQLDQACGSTTTRLPAGLVARQCHSGPNVIVLHAATPVHGSGPRYLVEVAP
jgi:uncharacterized protein YjbI with pentapeptide repeats